MAHLSAAPIQLCMKMSPDACLLELMKEHAGSWCNGLFELTLALWDLDFQDKIDNICWALQRAPRVTDVKELHDTHGHKEEAKELEWEEDRFREGLHKDLDFFHRSFVLSLDSIVMASLYHPCARTLDVSSHGSTQARRALHLSIMLAYCWIENARAHQNWA